MTFLSSFYYFLAALCQNPKWCVTSQEGKNKCETLAGQLNKRFSCVVGQDEKDCYKKIASKEADFGVFDGGMIYHAGKWDLNTKINNILVFHH